MLCVLQTDVTSPVRWPLLSKALSEDNVQFPKTGGNTLAVSLSAAQQIGCLIMSQSETVFTKSVYSLD